MMGSGQQAVSVSDEDEKVLAPTTWLQLPGMTLRGSGYLRKTRESVLRTIVSAISIPAHHSGLRSPGSWRSLSSVRIKGLGPPQLTPQRMPELHVRLSWPSLAYTELDLSSLNSASPRSDQSDCE